jgi:hypothetical protein
MVGILLSNAVDGKAIETFLELNYHCLILQIYC